MSFRIFIVVFCLIFLPFTFYGQSNYSSLNISKELSKNANAVVRLQETKIKVNSETNLEISIKRIITVLNKNGNKAVNAYVSYDPSTKIKNLQARIYDDNDKEIKQIKKRDFIDQSAVSEISLHEESRIKFLPYIPTQYPYTVVFSYTLSTINTAFLPPWSPVDGYSVSTEKSIYQLTHAEDLNLRIKEKNFEAFDIVNKSTKNYLQYELSNIPARIKEELSPPSYKMKPTLLVTLNKFHLEGVNGEAKDWLSLGEWQYYNLISNRDALSSETVNELTNLLKDINSPLEKVKKVYQYVQENTRYISVQLGIGGWMPIAANEVDRVKYGDCKGLTNYTKALLKSQGIESYYSVVWAGSDKRNMEHDFASMQGNHVILNIPDGDDDVWLECTSQVKPFGFLGDFTDDRDVLVLTPEGGKIKHTQTYINEQNKMSTIASYSLSEDGSLNGNIKIKTEGIQYDNRFRISMLSDKKQEEYYKTYWKNINDLNIEVVKLDNDKSAIQFTEKLNVSVKKYGELTNGRILFQINPFNCNTNIPKRYRNRNTEFEISRGFLDEDHYAIKLPASLKPEILPAPIKLKSKFGIYEVAVEMTSDSEILYKRKLLIKKGMYSKEEYDEYRNFKKQVAKGDKLKLVLKNK